jgi:hypothetical protein
VSFFDEDDEPTRTRRTARAPRPRRAAPADGGAGVDQQTLWTRRAVAIGGGLLLFILLVLVINACQDSRRKNALRDWNREATALVRQSDQEVGKQFFDTLRQGSSQSPEDLQTQVSSLRVQAENQLKQGKQLDTPDQLNAAATSMLEALELRRDGLDYIAQRISTALGNEGDVADQAIQGIASQMQAFLASDVLIRARVTPLVRETLKDDDVVADPVTTSGFLPALSWLEPSYVADQLGTQLSNNGSGRQNTTKEPAPGLHGTGLDSTTVDGVTLQPDPAANRVPIGGDLNFAVKFTNQGENDEFDIPVVVTLDGGSGKNIVGRKTVDTVVKGATATANITLPKKPTAGEVYTVTVEVKAVPGEEKTDNNKSTYNVLFQ